MGVVPTQLTKFLSLKAASPFGKGLSHGSDILGYWGEWLIMATQDDVLLLIL